MPLCLGIEHSIRSILYALVTISTIVSITNTSTNKETFGFKTTTSPPPVAELHDFEKRMLSFVQNIEFQPTNSTFQNKLQQDIRKIKKGNELFVPADKTTNFYRVKPEPYQSLLRKNITKT